MRWLLGAVLALVGGGCSPAQQKKVSSVAQACQPGVIISGLQARVCGSIDQALAEGTVNAIEAGARTVVITSTGGRPAEAIKIARSIRTHDVSVVVEGMCASACAYTIFLSAPRVRVAENAVVAFHHTTSSVIEAAEQFSDTRIHIQDREVSRIEADFMVEAGLDPAILYSTTAVLDPVCIGTGSRSGRAQNFIATRARYFVPTRSEAEAMRGRPFVGYWPSSAAEVTANYEHYRGKRGGRIRLRLARRIQRPRLTRCDTRRCTMSGHCP